MHVLSYTTTTTTTATTTTTTTTTTNNNNNNNNNNLYFLLAADLEGGRLGWLVTFGLIKQNEKIPTESPTIF